MQSNNFVNVAGFFNRSVPFALMGDMYTVAGQAIAGPQARERSVYNVTNRRAPHDAWEDVAEDSRMVFYGLSHWVRECLKPHSLAFLENTMAEIFMMRSHSFGGGLNFDIELWDRAKREFGNNLPVRIEALPEGSIFWPGEPYIQVTSLGEGYGEIAAMLEATMLGMVAGATARATVTRHLLADMVDQVERDNPGGENNSEVAQWMIHDFGMRASLTPLESIILGEAHLLSFRGTDTTPAAYSAWLDSSEAEGSGLGSVGTSILAHAHRIILGYDTEQEAVAALADACEACGDFPVASYLSDTYDFKDFVLKLAIPLALEYRNRGRGVCVVRPDSGDYLQNDRFITNAAIDSNLYRENKRGRCEATHLRILQGDSMNPEKMHRILCDRRSRWLNATSWGGFGIGGWLRAQSNRDVLSSAYKLAEVGTGRRPVVKLSETAEKMSVPGTVDITRCDSKLTGPTVTPRVPGFPSHTECVVYYDGSRPGDEAYGDVLFEPFMVKRCRAISFFDCYGKVHWDKGSEDAPVLSESIVAMRRDMARQYGREI